MQLRTPVAGRAFAAHPHPDAICRHGEALAEGSGGRIPGRILGPLPDRFVRHRDAAGGQHLLDHAQAQRETKIQPDRVADDFSGVAVAGVNRSPRGVIPPVYPTYPAPTKPTLGQLDGAAGSAGGRAVRKYGISDATFYKSRSRYGGMEVSDARKLKALEDGNRRLKKLLAETMLDASTLKEMLGKNF